jgi:hypothetical protein
MMPAAHIVVVVVVVVVHGILGMSWVLEGILDSCGGGGK